MLKPQMIEDILKVTVEERRAFHAKILGNNQPIDRLEDLRLVSRITTLCQVIDNVSYDPNLHELISIESERY